MLKRMTLNPDISLKIRQKTYNCRVGVASHATFFHEHQAGEESSKKAVFMFLFLGCPSPSSFSVNSFPDDG